MLNWTLLTTRKIGPPLSLHLTVLTMNYILFLKHLMINYVNHEIEI